MDMSRTDQGFDGDDEPVLDQYAIAVEQYTEIKAHIFHLWNTVPPVDGDHQELARFREEVLRVSNIVIPTIRGELQVVDPLSLTKIQQNIRTAALHDLEVMSEQLYNLLRSLPK
ncbi:MAG TPA: hypothetical protein DIU47_00210 [Candidatus Pacebacteria bacterium]|nr:MAG: hypothetical protein UX00_C0010G0039 [Microgenomates group bacterium GW2011_GWB1_45_17]KKU23601.1 MAG: hypothetical protein UX36_C0004G0054 [Microgenomates group bacterium GW2011_GWC1_46_15]KKU24320.1 MAG: hypothetical protein UX35_C0002G0054 [Microgenomates group bacterium GW2011_GWA1_46_15]HCR92370.1 hypothetical protein [Candidatus Paceibacterota bacterium]